MSEPTEAPARIVAATREIMLRDGFAALSTRKVADAAGVPLSQIHYHFGSKEQLVLATLEAENERLLGRQSALYATDEPLSAQWARACDYLDDDLASGYVRILQEMIGAGLSNDVIAAQVRSMISGWGKVLTAAFEFHESRGVSLAPLTPAHAVALVSASFLGAESLILLGHESPDLPLRDALRALGDVFAAIEAGNAAVSA